MAIIKCPECGKEISDKSTKCPSCGYPLRKEVFLSHLSEKSDHFLRKAQQTMGVFEKSFLISAFLYFICGIGIFILRLSIDDFGIPSLLDLFVYIGMGFFILKRNKKGVLAFTVFWVIINLIALISDPCVLYALEFISSLAFVITVIVSMRKMRIVNATWFLAGVLRMICFVYILMEAGKTQSIQWQSTQWWAVAFSIMEILAMLFAGIWLKIDANTSDYR